MPVSISFTFPPELMRNQTTRRAIENAALFVRDLWLARSPYVTGGYARGLMSAGSIRIGSGRFSVTNQCAYAQHLEFGTRSFNIGLAILARGRGVKTSADGSRYKIIKVEPKGRASFRKASVAASVQRSFQKMFPPGVRAPRISRYGQIKPYRERKSLRKPLRAKAPLASAMRGIFVVSEKAIRERGAWQMPAKAPRRFAQMVQKEAQPVVVQAIRAAIQGERARQRRLRGNSPGWYRPGMSFGIIPPKW